MTAPSAIPQAAVWEDFIDIFCAPSSVFRVMVLSVTGRIPLSTAAIAAAMVWLAAGPPM